MSRASARSSRICCARSLNLRPTSVGVIPRVVRFSSVVPNSASMRAIRRLTIDFATPNRRAARAKTPVGDHLDQRAHILQVYHSRALGRRLTAERHVAVFFVGRTESILWIVVTRRRGRHPHPASRSRCLKGCADLLLHSELLGAPREALALI